MNTKKSTTTESTSTLRERFSFKLNDYTYVYFFIVLFVLLIVLNRNAIFTSTNEVGDFAANSILIQKAKHLRLLAGNYSRVGFNHPGPAILYVLAFGELVFHDWLHWVSPIGGQMIAGSFYAAFWISLAAAMFMRLSQNRWETWIFLIAMCAILAHASAFTFGGIWFPTLYILPFATFMIGLALFVLGDAWSLIPLALACGFLINGHASFVAITGIMLAGSLGINLVLARYNHADVPSWLNLVWRRTSSYAVRRAVAALVVLALFFVPLLILTILFFPGPAADYAHYGKIHIHNPWPASLYSLSWYWSPSIFASVSFIVGSIAAILFLPFRYKASFLASLGLAGLASLLYTRYGIDNLVDPTMRYIGLFTIALPAIAGGLVAVLLLRLLARRWQVAAVLAIALVGVTYSGLQVRTTQVGLGQYNDPEIPGLFAQLQALGPQKLAFSLDTGGDWGQTWSTVAGLQLYGARQHIPPFVCIARNWHILFTPAAQCAPDDLEHARRVVVGSVDIPLGAAHPVITRDGINIVDVPKTCLAPGDGLTIAKETDEFQNRILGAGWTAAEGMFAWSNGKEARLYLCVKPGVKAVNIDLGAFLPKSDSSQTVAFSIGRKAMKTVTFNGALPHDKVQLALPADGDQDVEVVLNIDHPVSPRASGLSSDTRPIAVSLYGVDAE